MNIEGIKRVKLLATLKGTVNGKQVIWLKGTEWDGKTKPFPKIILDEMKAKRIGVLEIEYVPAPTPEPTPEPGPQLKTPDPDKTEPDKTEPDKTEPDKVETTPDVPQKDIQKEGAPKKVAKAAKKTAPKSRRKSRRKTIKK